ncbi:hypothetical protein ACFQ36_14730, partial [Arthrobacter sp. GCM10027362]
MPGLTAAAMAPAGTSPVDVLAELLLFGGTILLIFGMAAVLSTWLVVRRIKRSRRLRSGWRKGTLTVRTLAADDAGRHLARLRLQ